MSSEAPAIRIRRLGKRYRIAHRPERHITLAEAVLDRLRHPLSSRGREDYWALRDLDLDVARGEAVGIIGRNGAGKSTFLKILSRITHPTEGEVDLFGRVGSLLEVGTGFHPELTGRENVFLNGSILGMRTREIERRFDEIVEFAGVERFLDTPIKRFSSGMQVRLAFAVAAFLDTEILVIDEVLAVGDADFQARCLDKMGDAIGGGRTVLFVSHNAAAVEQLTSRCVLLDDGMLVSQGPSGVVLAEYAQLRKGLSDVSTWDSRRAGDGLGQTVRIARVRVGDASGSFPQSSRPRVDVEIAHSDPGRRVVVMYRIMRIDGVPVGTGITSDVCLPPSRAISLRFDLAADALAPGHYFLAVAVSYDVAGGLVPLDSLEESAHFEVLADLRHPVQGRWSPEWGVTVLPESDLAAAPASVDIENVRGPGG